MKRLQSKIENVEEGEFIVIKTEDGSTYNGEVCKIRGRIGRTLEVLVKSEPQTVIEIEYGGKDTVEDIELTFESQPSKNIHTITI